MSLIELTNYFTLNKLCFLAVKEKKRTMEKNNNQSRSRKRTFACLHAFRLSFQSDEKQNEFYLQTE